MVLLSALSSVTDANKQDAYESILSTLRNHKRFLGLRSLGRRSERASDHFISIEMTKQFIRSALSLAVLFLELELD